MSRLHEMNCEPCRVGAPTVTNAERARYTREVPQWEVVEVGGVPILKRSFRF